MKPKHEIQVIKIVKSGWIKKLPCVPTIPCISPAIVVWDLIWAAHPKSPNFKQLQPLLKNIFAPARHEKFILKNEIKRKKRKKRTFNVSVNDAVFVKERHSFEQLPSKAADELFRQTGFRWRDEVLQRPLRAEFHEDDHLAAVDLHSVVAD